jgi:hypothetical protein
MTPNNKFLATFRFLLKRSIGFTLIAFFSILANIASVILFYNLTDQFSGAHPPVILTAPVDVTAGFFALLAGLLMLLANFKMALANGVSRKTFLLANLPAAAVLAAVLALNNLIVPLVVGEFQPIVTVTQLIYPKANWIGLLLVQFAQYYLLIAAGWLIVLAYYRGSVAVRWAISLAPFALYFLIRAVDAYTGGKLAAAVGELWRSTMRSTPGMATITLLVSSAILVGLVYLLIRRAPLKA